MPGFELTGRQREANELLGGDQRHTLLVGGSRSGKTTLLVRAVLIRAVRAAHSRHAILRFRGNAARSSIVLDTLPKVQRMCFPGLPMQEHRQDGYHSLPNGSEIWIGGLDDKERVEKILGQEYVTLYLNECSQIPYASAVVAQTRLAQSVPGLKQRVYYDLNPVGKGHWTNALFGEKRDPISRQPLSSPDDYRRMFLNPGDNADNLAPEYVRSLQELPERQRKRFYEGAYVDELDGALWTLEIIEKGRRELADIPEARRRRIVVAVDPSGAASDQDDAAGEVGISVAAMSDDGHAYVLADMTVKDGPSVWGKVAVQAFRDWRADLIVAEKNFGGEMVRFVIQTAGPGVPVKVITASRGKHVRADPVAVHYEQGRVHHVGRFPDLEDQLCAFTTAGYRGARSPDRADACVWALTDLLLSEEQEAFDVPIADFIAEPRDIPRHWPRVFALDMDRSRVAAIFGALDTDADTVWLYGEYVSRRVDLGVHAAALKDRTKQARDMESWIPGIFDHMARGRTEDEGNRIVNRLLDFRVDVHLMEVKPESGLHEMTDRLSGKRLRVFSTLTEWLGEYRNYRRDKKDELPDADDGLMRATGLLCVGGLQIAATDIALEREADDGWAAESKSSVTGY